MNKRHIATGLIGVAFISVVIWVVFSRKGEGPSAEEERAQTVTTVFVAALDEPEATLREKVVVPAAYVSRTGQEQEDFLRKAFRDEISSEGLRVLHQEAEFGPLLSLFPVDGRKWAAQLGVNPTNCVAWRTGRDNLRAELVLLRSGGGYRIVRCNNVQQLAR